jgi:hypothetical protein
MIAVDQYASYFIKEEKEKSLPYDPPVASPGRTNRSPSRGILKKFDTSL